MKRSQNEAIAVADWSHKEVWTRSAQTFCVEVQHFQVPPYESVFGGRELGTHRWTVNAYIYPTHPRFAKFDGDGIFQDAANDLPLHAGASLLAWHRDNDGKITSVQVASDYNHDGDQMFTFEDEFAGAVKRDAEELFDFLSDPIPPKTEDA